MILLSPYDQKQQEGKIRHETAKYRWLSLGFVAVSLLIILFFFIGNYKINYIQDDYYVYGDEKFRIDPEFNDDSVFNIVIIDTITPIDTLQPLPDDVKHVDLRANFTEIKSQGQQGACLAFTLSSVMEYMVNVAKQEYADFSEAFLYYEARRKAGDEGRDIGSYYSYALQTLQNEGICSENYMPYNQYDYLSMPSSMAYNNAIQNRISDVRSLDFENIESLKSALYNGYPVAISVNLYSSFGNGNGGVIPMPKSRETSYGAHGSHAMVIVGYDDDEQWFIVRNSWGTNFGDNGYCYMPYAYISDEDLTNYACVITKLRQ